MFKIINPIDAKLSVVIKGVPYEVNAKSELANLSEEVAFYWKMSLHNFIRVIDESTNQEIITPTISEKNTEEVEEEVIEEIEETVVEKTPKKKVTKK